MAKVIIDELKSYKKEFGRDRKTSIEDAEEIVIEEKKVEEIPVVFLMDRFGYARTVDESVYERNKEAAENENRVLIHCKNTSRLCVFTDTGKQHLLKVMDVPYGKFRDKGTPIDNLCNYDSKEETAIAVMPMEKLIGSYVTFVTSQASVKRVEGSEFDVAKRTIAATKLQDGDKVIAVYVTPEETHLVLRSHEGYMLRFPLDQVPVKKKTAIGVRGMRLGTEDYVEEAYFLDEFQPTQITVDEKMVHLNRLRIGARDTKGSKIRG